MPALPWMKWFPQDWMSDPKLSRCSPATRGVWADAICAMMLLGDFKLEGTDDELARQCRCSAGDIQTSHKDLERTNTADVSEQNGCKIWVCRRLKRTNKTSALRAAAGRSRWSKPHANTEHAPSDFAYAHSASASASVRGPLEEGAGGNLYHKDSRAALHWLNEKSGVHYREVDSNLSVISARLKEPEVTIEGVKEMIEHQVAEWKGNDMEKYLRPETLFGKSKFDSYYANRKSKIISRDSAKRFDRAKGTLNEGVAKQYDLRKIQAHRTLQDARRS